MAEKNLSAPARSRSGGSVAGVRHIKFRHTERFTVLGNHLTQHPDLSLTAIGLAAHIQSLPDGIRIGIKELAKKFAESEARIAAALRELGAYGYLVRSKERTASGTVVTRTVFYDNPTAGVRAAVADLACEAGEPPADPPAVEAAEGQPPVAAPPLVVDVDVDVEMGPPAMDTAKTQLPLPVPKSEPTAEIHRTAADLLAGLRGVDPRLRLAQAEVHRLAPAVAAWLERGLSVTDVRRALLERLPDEPIRHPAGLVGHRLAVLLPPPLPATAATRSFYALPPVRRAPFQTCDGCERAFRSEKRGERCQDCRFEGEGDGEDEARIRAVIAAALAA
ncbi:helix-turn-helix domain-containing protein [Streptomyces sp. ISL-96]|uniref:helix-turn-helix domain-containing protein n=1 Tax=Streptomyces sp. ISL-96 TaxID=2819191 RepID=UPI001BE7A42C|nr:helix-turn-helix domain-containing protein [Streptomyces sp. ISL-96]MBT2488106.1 helix-turn-helix domain-containing protein [Streptomyces sp. ISL-96]